MDKNIMCNVRNRSAGMVVYRVPEDGIRREFRPGEVKRIKFGELEKLSWRPGGRELMQNYLQIEINTATDALGIIREPEYEMGTNDIIKLLKEGSMDEFLDCLDFAPEGVIDLVKQLAVELPITNMEKIEAIKKRTGFDVMAAIQNVQKVKADEKAASAPAPANKQRRVQKEEDVAETTTPAPKKRRTTTQTKAE